VLSTIFSLFHLGFDLVFVWMDQVVGLADLDLGDVVLEKGMS
jgi:hypothetical protein